MLPTTSATKYIPIVIVAFVAACSSTSATSLQASVSAFLAKANTVLSSPTVQQDIAGVCSIITAGAPLATAAMQAGGGTVTDLANLQTGVAAASTLLNCGGTSPANVNQVATSALATAQQVAGYLGDPNVQAVIAKASALVPAS